MTLQRPIQHLINSPGFFKNFPSLMQDLLNCFRSVHLAIVLLAMLAIGTIAGVILPSVYSSFWFITLEILFFFNLLIGSFQWLKPALLAATKISFISSPEVMSNQPEAHSLIQLSYEPVLHTENRIIECLKRLHYKTYRDGKGNLYACKGNITRIGPCIAHFGILICLIAALYGSFSGFKASNMVVPGNSFAIKESDTFKTNIAEPFWLGSVPDWKIYVGDFKMEPYKDRPDIVKQYYSQIKIIAPDGKVLKNKTISVNNPLLMDDVYIYQASFEPTGNFNIEIDNTPLTIGLNDQFNGRPLATTSLSDGSVLFMFPFFARQDADVTENQALFFLRQPDEIFEKGKIPIHLRLTEGQSGRLKNHTLTYKKTEMATGLQINRSPEVTVMYTAYLLIIIGTILCFFSQRQIWFLLKEELAGKTSITFYAKTNKAVFSFRKELQAIEAALNKEFLDYKTTINKGTA